MNLSRWVIVIDLIFRDAFDTEYQDHIKFAVMK